VRGRYAGCSTTTTTAVEQEYEFTGYETDALSGLQYAGARYYDPVLGTFLTHDPKRVTPNPYSYANWDPVNMVDPNGMEPFTIVGAIVVFAIGSAIGFTTAAIRAFMNGATWGEALKAGAISGAISGATAVVGAYLLQPAVSLAVAKLVSESATHLASALLFASSLAQAGYGISQNDYTGIIGLGLSVGVGWAFARGTSEGAQAADADGRPGIVPAENTAKLNEGGREPGTVYLTGHPAFGAGPMHTAIEYTDEAGSSRWISAQNDSGKLKSGVGTPSNGIQVTDMPLINMTLGQITPPKGVSASEYFKILLQADGAYCDCLPYETGIFGFGSGYNSNGYTAGLVAATRGSASADLTKFLGGDRPVPSEYFSH